MEKGPGLNLNREKLLKTGWKYLRWAIVLGTLGLMALALYRERGEIGPALTEANSVWLLLSLALNLLASLLYVTVWDDCARQLGATGGFRGALVALSVAGAARYLPGGIWPVAGLVYFGPVVGLPRKTMPVLAALAQAIHLLAAGLVAALSFGVVLGLIGLNLWSLWSVVALSLLAGTGLLLALPRYLLPLFRKLAKPVRPFSPWSPALRSALFWLLNGLRLWWLSLAFGPASLNLLPYLILAGAATTLLSALFFFVPLGLGVVEVSLGWWLSLVLPWPVALAIVALNRVSRTLNDFIFLALSRLVTNRSWSGRH